MRPGLIALLLAIPAAAQPHSPNDRIPLAGAAALPAAGPTYQLTGVWSVPGGVASSYLRSDGRYVSWADVGTKQFRILDTLTGDVHDVTTDTAALNQGGGRWIDGRLYVACYDAPCVSRTTWVIDPADWSSTLYHDGGWLLGRVDGADVLAYEFEGASIQHGHVGVPMSNPHWHHGQYCVEYGGGRACYTTWGYDTAEYDPLTGGVEIIETNISQPRVSPGGTVTDRMGSRVRIGGVWHDSPAPWMVSYLYAVSDAGVGIAYYYPTEKDALWGTGTYGLVDLVTGEPLYDAGLAWGYAIEADGTAWFGRWDSIERVELVP